MSPFWRCVTATALWALAGCAWLNDDSGLVRNSANDYLEAREARPLVIPADLGASPVRDAWTIPNIEERPLARHFPDGAPRPDAIFRENDDAVKIQKLGGRQWLVTGGAPATVWPVVRQFLADNGIAVAQELPRAGRIDGEWLRLDGDAWRDVIRAAIDEARPEAEGDGRERIRFKIEHGIAEDSSEIHIRYENENLAAPVDGWPAQSAALAVEEKLLHEFGAYYGAGIAAESVSMVALDIAGERKAVVERDAQGYPLLRLNVDFERAWAVVGQALQRAELTVTELERDAGVFQVEVSPRQLTGGGRSFLSRFLPGGGDGGTQPFDIRIAASGESQLVQVFQAKGQRAPQDVSQQILVMLREFAS